LATVQLSPYTVIGEKNNKPVSENAALLVQQWGICYFLAAGATTSFSSFLCFLCFLYFLTVFLDSFVFNLLFSGRPGSCSLRLALSPDYSSVDDTAKETAARAATREDRILFIQMSSKREIKIHLKYQQMLCQFI
jgi:hypothetical protein